jgi:hypothetical protein
MPNWEWKVILETSRLVNWLPRQINVSKLMNASMPVISDILPEFHHPLPTSDEVMASASAKLIKLSQLASNAIYG